MSSTSGGGISEREGAPVCRLLLVFANYIGCGPVGEERVTLVVQGSVVGNHCVKRRTIDWKRKRFGPLNTGFL